MLAGEPQSGCCDGDGSSNYPSYSTRKRRTNDGDGDGEPQCFEAVPAEQSREVAGPQRKSGADCPLKCTKKSSFLAC